MNGTINPESVRCGEPTRFNWQMVCAGTVLMFLFAFGLRVLNIEHEPITDELYHLLAAASWANDGTLAIADGEYRRASLFTKLIGVVYGATSGDVISIRLFCIAIGSLLVAAVFLWSARNIGLLGAIIAALLLSLMPGAIFLSQHIRFYSLHALIFFLIAAGIYALVTKPAPFLHRAVLGLALILLLLLDVHLQVTTLVGLAGICAWIVLYYHSSILDWIRKGGISSLIIFSLVFAFLAFAYFGRSMVGDLVGVYQSSAMWNTGDSPTYYHDFYKQQLGAFWSLAPVAFLIAVIARPKPAIFCICIFVVALVVQSFGGMRSERFLFYAMPFFFIIWGIAGSAIFHWLKSQTRTLLTESGLVSAEGVLGKVAPVSLIGLAAMFLLLSTPAITMSARMVSGRTAVSSGPPVYWDRYSTDWESASSELRRLADEVEVTLVSQALQSLYFIGDYDYSISATALADIRSSGSANNIDPRTGRTIFDDEDTLKTILRCNKSGIVIIHAPAWRKRTRVTNLVADVIEANMSKLEVPEKWGLLVYRWRSSPDSPDCSSD